MGILRADIVSHSQLQPTGSVAFDGTTDYLTIPASSAWFSGLANSTVKKSFTVEWWQYWNAVSGYVDLLDVNYTAGLLLEAANGKYTVYAGGGSQGVEATAAVTGQWYHYALVFYSGAPLAPGSIVLYRDGEVSASGNVAGNVQVGNSSTVLSIGAKQSNGAYSLNGYISNFRWCDRVVYNAPFTPPKFELTAIAGTQLLCCQSSSSVTEAAVIPGGLSITANGNAAASAFAPDLKKDITDTGVVFEDNTKFDTLSYMVPPGGTTAESNRGRGVVAAGENPSKNKSISYIEIQSMGIAKDFGDLTKDCGETKSVGSSTRGVIALTGDNPVTRETLEYITFATESNSTDFGDLNVAISQRGGASNQTRGIWSGGLHPGSTTYTDMDYITIATLGDAADFGNLSVSRADASALASPTRMVVGGGITPGTYRVDVDYVTIATTGNATDFGDLTEGRRAGTAVASSTRGVFGPGKAPSVSNVIDYITIASTGNATDFGDALVARGGAGSASNSIRGLFTGGYSPSLINGIEFITIATLGNGADFGDMTYVSQYAGGCSDSHGGIS